MVKNLPMMWETRVLSLGWEDPLMEDMTPPPIFFPGEFPRTEESGEVQSMESQRVISHTYM